MDRPEIERRRTREAVLGGGRAPRVPRQQVAASWRRVAAAGLNPESNAEIAPLPVDDLERRRLSSPLAPLVPRLAELLRPVTGAGQLVVVADRDGRVLWRLGGSGVRRNADDLGFVDGSAWTEGNVGTNAIGTALVLGSSVVIRGAEHFVESHSRWGCAAAPVLDPWTGDALGVIDVSGSSRSLHPAELALVETAARVCSLELLEQHNRRLDRLRAHAAPLLARLSGAALVTDREGHLAAATGFSAPGRVTLPGDMTVGQVWLPTLGAAVADALPGGWLLRLTGQADASVAAVDLDLSGRPRARVHGADHKWTVPLTRRHAELLLALAHAGDAGRTAAELADDLFADPTRVVTVRAEVSRLRRDLGAVLVSRPYRFAPGVRVRVVLPDRHAALLPGSSAPVVHRLRGSGAGFPTISPR